jgi:transketolase
MVSLASDSQVVFLTGDLGFKALEPLSEALDQRFINAGVAEQNMVAVGAGLARSGLNVWLYSIAPFMFARPFEQIRNDICLHNLPVKLVGNGGGYGYGVMGATHHALEDYGALLTLANMHTFIPAFDADVTAIIEKLHHFNHPAYLRLGLSELPADFPTPTYAPWRRLLQGNGPTLLVVGPLVGGLVAALRQLELDQRPNLWLLTELPIKELPTDFLADLAQSQRLVVVEEHVAQGGIGQNIAYQLLLRGLAPPSFKHHAAVGYRSGRYGSQKFHRTESGLDLQAILATLELN